MAVIVAGDGDYVPVLESVKRLGLHVAVAFLTADTSKELRIAADAFKDVTEQLCQDWQRFHEDRARRDAKAAEADREEPRP